MGKIISSYRNGSTVVLRAVTRKFHRNCNLYSQQILAPGRHENSGGSITRLDSDSIFDGRPNPQLSAQVEFGHLNGNIREC